MRRVGGARCLGAVVTTIVLALAYPALSAADTFDDPGFATEVVASVPPYTLVGLAFAPDGRLFVWQKNGVVRIIKNGVMLATPFVDLSSHVNTFDDRGMWGLAFDPNFASNGYVYVSYTYENAGNPNDQGPKTARLTRITASPTNPDVALPGRDRDHGHRSGRLRAAHSRLARTASLPTAGVTRSASSTSPPTAPC